MALDSVSGEDEAASFSSLDENGDVIEWLRSRGRVEESREVIERVIVHGMLTDMCQFLFESIECAAKGKMGVAFGLLRKPFRDQLFILEWLLADRDGFIAEFEKGPNSIDLGSLLSNRRDWMKHIVGNAAQRSEFSDFLDPQFIWEVRFDASVHWSLQAMWNQALHLVTTHKHQSTDHGSLNFAFIQDEERMDLQSRYYQQIPSMLAHICGVLGGLIARWAPKFTPMGQLFYWRVSANLELAVKETCEDVSDSFGLEAVNSFLESISWKCDACSSDIRIKNDSDLELFVVDCAVRCPSCSTIDDRLAELDLIEEDDEE